MNRITISLILIFAVLSFLLGLSMPDRSLHEAECTELAADFGSRFIFDTRINDGLTTITAVDEKKGTERLEALVRYVDSCVKRNY